MNDNNDGQRRNRLHVQLASLLLGSASVACGSSTSGSDDAADGSTSSAITTAPGATSGFTSGEASDAADATATSPEDGDSDGSTETSGAHDEARMLVAFDLAANEIPEGITSDGDHLYVGLSLLGRIVRVDLHGSVEDFGALPTTPEPLFAGGLATLADGSVLFTAAGFSPSEATGVYRIPAEGGTATLISTHPGYAFPNALAPDDAGDVYVSDSIAGAIFKIAADGTTQLWSDDPLLAAGDVPACGESEAPFRIGPNGIAIDDSALIVVNTDQASILRIPIREDGSAGEVERVIGPDCDNLNGPDGIAVEAPGRWLVAVNGSDTLVAVTAGGTLELVSNTELLDHPASVEVVEGTNGRYALVTNHPFGGDPATARPGVVEIPLP